VNKKPLGVDKRFRDLEPIRIAMEAEIHSIRISEQIRDLGHEVIVANVRETRRGSCPREATLRFWRAAEPKLTSSSIPPLLWLAVNGSGFGYEHEQRGGNDCSLGVTVR
jgi:hypothetical protein